MNAKEYKSIGEMISAIQDNSKELTRAFTIEIIEDDLLVEGKYILRNFTGTDLTELLQYTSEQRYNTSSISTGWRDRLIINLFK